jgi:DNA (cytosine-5)-methyltransferase 1
MFNFPHAPVLCRDVTKLAGTEVVTAAELGFSRLHPGRAWDGHVDAVIGGPPCQGFSTGGKRRPDDERNNLILEFVRMVIEIRPRMFCMENVSGLLESRFDQVRLAAVSALRAAGYRVSGYDKSINSWDFGVPQVRRRVFIVGTLSDVQLQPPIEADHRVTVAQALDGLPDHLSYDELYSDDEVRLSQRDVERRFSASSTYSRILSGLRPDPEDRSYPRVWNSECLTNSRRTIHLPETVARFSETPRGSVEQKSRLFRLPLDGPSRTLRAGSGSERGAHTSPRPIHPTVDRVITIREAARLHGYPDWFRFHTTNWHGHRQIGNSVPPPLARAVARTLLDQKGRDAAATDSARPLGDSSLLRLNRTQALQVVDAVTDELPAQRRRQIPADEPGLPDSDGE